VHISQLADRFIDDPKKVVKVGQVVKVRVMEVNEKLKRISLSMKSAGQANAGRSTTRNPVSTAQKSPTLNDLKTKFNRKS
jgi:uncharacterized protein